MANQKKTKRLDRPESRVLIRWTDEIDQKVLLMVQHVCMTNKIKIPWDKIAYAMGPKFTEGSILQHLSKLRNKMLNDDTNAKAMDEGDGTVLPLGASRKRKAGGNPSPDTEKVAEQSPSTGGKAQNTEYSEDDTDGEWNSKKSSSTKKKAAKGKSAIKKELAGLGNKGGNPPPSKRTRGIKKDYSKLDGGESNEDDGEESKVKVKHDGSDDVEKKVDDKEDDNNTVNGACGGGAKPRYDHLDSEPIEVPESPVEELTLGEMRVRAAHNAYNDMLAASDNNNVIQAATTNDFGGMGTVRMQNNNPMSTEHLIPRSTENMYTMAAGPYTDPQRYFYGNQYQGFDGQRFSNGFGSQGFHSGFGGLPLPNIQAPPMPVQYMTPRQSLSSESTQALPASVQHGNVSNYSSMDHISEMPHEYPSSPLRDINATLPVMENGQGDFIGAGNDLGKVEDNTGAYDYYASDQVM